jgi:hypothetical protein
MKWDFNKLKVTNKNGFGKWITQSLSRSPYYLSLLEYPSLKSKEIFTEYFNILNADYEMSYDNFIKLYKDMRDNGVSKDFNVNITADGVISDGQHRMAVLHYLGADTIENNKTIKWRSDMIQLRDPGDENDAPA